MVTAAFAAGGRVFPPDIPMAKSRLDRLIDRRPLHLHELGLPAQPAGDGRGYLDVEAAHLRRVGRVGLDERRAPLGVAAPA
jgi:hypothetical protein